MTLSFARLLPTIKENTKKRSTYPPASFLSSLFLFYSESTIHTACIGCLKALMNNSVSPAHGYFYDFKKVGISLEVHCFCSSVKKCFLLNSCFQNGRSEVLAHPNCINIITQSLITENLKTKTAGITFVVYNLLANKIMNWTINFPYDP